MKVLKFGGTSVGTSKSLAHVKKIVEGLNGPAIVVVSALGGLTDRLISTANDAAAGNAAYKNNMDGIANRHYDIISETIDPCKQKEVIDIISPMLADLSDLYDGVALIRNLPEKTLDRIVSYGERISSVIVSRIIAGAKHFDSTTFIKTEKWFNKNIADSKLTDSLIRQAFGSFGNGVAVCGGFIATDRDNGEITNLGRGGSDYTAALIAASLNADELEIWTDVDGFMTADPRIISNAKVIDHLSFVESMELCSFGAKVIYPPTIYPVFHKNIPIRILNTFNHEAPGTWITDNRDSAPSGCIPKGATTMRNISLFTIEGDAADNTPDVNSRTFNTLAKNGISVILVSQSVERSSFSFALSEHDADNALKALLNEFAPDMEEGRINRIARHDNKAILAIVGENIGDISSIGPRIFNSLQRQGIEVLASSHGASSSNHAYVVDADDTNHALQAVHEIFFE